MAATGAPRAEQAPADAEKGFKYVLAQPAFRLIWFAQVAAQLADKFLMFSLVILAYRLSGSSTSVATTLIAYTLPSVFIAPAAGVLADRYDRKAIMVGTNLGRALLVALIPVVAMNPVMGHTYPPLLVIVFLFAAVGQLFGPAEAAAIPTVLSKPGLIAANSMVLMTMVITLVVGGALAPIASRLSLYAPYWYAVVLFVAAGILIALARIPRTPPMPATDRHPFQQVLVELKEGIDYLRGSTVLTLSFLQFAIAILVVFMIFTLAPAYVSHVLGILADDSYVILVPAMVGAALSAVLLGRFGTNARKSTLLLVGLVSCGLTLFALANVPLAMRHIAPLRQNAIWSGALFSFLLGLEFGTLMIPSVTYLMEKTEDQLRGRIFALLFMVVNGATALPVLVAAGLADTVGTDNVIAGSGILLVATGLCAWLVARRAFDAEEL